MLYADDFTKTYSIEPYSVISDTKMISEGSALLKSKKYDAIWTLNDSGNNPNIFAFDFNGMVIKPDWVKKYSGIRIVDAVNIDWEAITEDDDGNLIIADTGNNYNYRTDLAVYKVAEPNPYYSNEQGIIAKYLIKYPDQTAFPPDSSHLNYDAESVFYYRSKLHIISKNRSTPVANIYVFDSLLPWTVNVPRILTSFDFKSIVTDAALSPDGKYLAVITYNHIWLFETKDKENPFNNNYYFKEISLGQCEGITFLDKENLVISNEKGFLFKINISEIKKSLVLP
jgi:hypothetical protein